MNDPGQASFNFIDSLVHRQVTWIRAEAYC